MATRLEVPAATEARETHQEMIEDRSEPNADQPESESGLESSGLESSGLESSGLESSGLESDVAQRQRTLELELTRLRNEASAARLEARAAEIELMIRGLVSRSGKDRHRRSHQRAPSGRSGRRLDCQLG